ncbi:MAG: SUMF1/EgtB/PvdO family nonheme iron enzyme [Candidatus Omnitrophota bacterium]
MTGQTDFDAPGDRALTIAWEGETLDAKCWDIFVRRNWYGYQFLARTSPDSRMFTWKEGATPDAPSFNAGPQFGDTYQFILIRNAPPIDENDKIRQSSYVGFNRTGFSAISFNSPPVLKAPRNRMIVHHDLLTGNIPTPFVLTEDEKSISGIMLSWDFMYEFNDVVDYHIFVSDTLPENYTFLGSTGSGDIPYFWWTSTPLFHTAAKYQNGPQLEKCYRFFIIGVAKNIKHNRRLYGLWNIYTPQDIYRVDLPNLDESEIPLDFIRVKAGSFMFGSPEIEPNRNSDEGPQFEYTINQDYYLSRYKLTRAQYFTIMNKKESYRQSTPYGISSWQNNLLFIEYLNRLQIGSFRLPTEAEWEFAYRAGVHTAYYWGEEFQEDKRNQYSWANYDVYNSPNVGLKMPNYFGLFDMQGILTEICWNCYDPCLSNSIDNKIDSLYINTPATRGADRQSRDRDFRIASRYRVTNEYPGDATNRYRYSYGIRLVKIPDEFVTPTPTPKPALEEITIELPNFPNDSLKLEMVRIPVGTFQLGGRPQDPYRAKEELPVREITISKDFYIGKYELTQEQWFSIMGKYKAYVYNLNYPARGMSWNQCQQMIQKLNTMGLGTFRMPTEAEWEYVARAGTNTTYFWGDLADDYSHQYTLLQYGLQPIVLISYPVGESLPNPWGIYDTVGSVKEWCSDWYIDTYEYHDAIDPQGPSEPSIPNHRVARGGHSGLYYINSRCSARSYIDQDNDTQAAFEVGLRLVRDYP